MGNPLVKAALTSCSMSMLGDCLAQLLTRRPEKQVTLWGQAAFAAAQLVAEVKQPGGYLCLV